MNQYENIVICSGYFNPLSYHHLDYLEAAKNIKGTISLNKLIVIVNSDKQVELKKSIPFQDEQTRLRIVKSIKCVDEVMLSIDDDNSVAQTIKKIYDKYTYYNLYFVNGGPPKYCGQEFDVCAELKIHELYGIGGHNKIESSSWLIEAAAKEWIKRKLEL